MGGRTVLYSRGQGGISGTAGTSGMRATPPGLWALRVCCWRSRCSCSACIVARICNCCAMNSDVFGLEGRGREHQRRYRTGNPRGLSRENVPHPENAHDGFPTTDFFLLFLFPLAIFDSPEISLCIDALCTLLDRRRGAECLLHYANTLLHEHVPVKNGPNQQGVYPYHKIISHVSQS